MIKAWKSLLGMMGKNIIIASIALVVFSRYFDYLFRKEASLCYSYVS